MHERTQLLLIEDDPLVRPVLREMLTFLGYGVDEAKNGDEGLAMFDPGRHAVVLTDYRLPGRNGAEVARAIRLRKPATPVILMSGSALGLSPGEVGLFTAIVEKPVGLVDAARAVARALGDGV